MNDSSRKSNTRDLLNKIFVWVMISGILSSIVLFVVGYIYNNEIVRDIARIIGSIVIGAVIVNLIQVKLLGEFYREQSREAITPDIRNVEEKVIEEMKKIIPGIKTETIDTIEDIKNEVVKATQFMTEGIGVLSGAKSSGIVNIYPSRYQKILGYSVIDTIEKDLYVEGNSIKIMGISLGDFFLDRGVLHKIFLNLLDKNIEIKPGCAGISIKALIVDPKCETLKERARWEAGEEFYREPAFFDSTTFIETDGAARIAKRLCEKYKNILEVRLYTQAPTAFVLLTSRFAFIESYNYADRGSNVPILQILAGESLYIRYEKHFDNIWRVSKEILKYSPFEDKEKTK